jgi:hypothetical protein
VTATQTTTIVIAGLSLMTADRDGRSDRRGAE